MWNPSFRKSTEVPVRCGGKKGARKGGGPEKGASAGRKGAREGGSGCNSAISGHFPAISGNCWPPPPAASNGQQFPAIAGNFRQFPEIAETVSSNPGLFDLYYLVSVLSEKKGPSGFVVCILWSFLFCCFVLNFFTPLKKRPPKTGHSKNPKKQRCRKKKRTKTKSVAQLCSQIVFLIFWGWALKCTFVLKTLLK